MTDYKQNYWNDEEPEGSWSDVIVCTVVILALFSVFGVFWTVLPGAQSVDDVLQIDPPQVHSPFKSEEASN